jgi:hypothetical protein
MTQKAAIWTACIGVVVIGILVGLGLITTSSLRSDINSQGQQIARLHAEIHTLTNTHELTVLQAQVKTLQGKLHPGLANDVITCGDLQNMGLQGIAGSRWTTRATSSSTPSRSRFPTTA